MHSNLQAPVSMPLWDRLKAPLKPIALLAFYVLLAKAVALIFVSSTAVSFLWLASGMAMVAVLQGGYRYLPVVLLGALLGSWLSGMSPTVSLANALRHAAAILFGVWLINREGRFDPALRRLSDYLRIVLLALIVGLFVATITTLLTSMGLHVLDTACGVRSFMQRWVGNAFGIVVVMPLVLIWRRLPRREWLVPIKVGEATLIIAMSSLVGQVIFLDWLQDSLGQIARGYWMYLFVTWAAVRMGPHGVSLILAIAAVQAILGAQMGTGFFADDIAKTHLSNYFFYFLCLSVSGMSLAMHFTERRLQQRQLQDLNANLEEHVRQRTEELAKANKELEAFSYSVSHDLRTPLRALNGYAHILRDGEAGALSPEGKDMLERIWKNANKMGVLIDNILQFSRIGKAEMAWKETDMGALAHGAADEIRGEYPAAQVRIADLPRATGDEAMLCQVWANLVGNAFKFSAKQEHPEIEIGSETLDGETVFYIRDNGAGFDMAHADKLFGVFQRMHTERDFPGTGAGLSIVKRIIERHGGRIWAEAEVGKGATFRFTLAG